MAFRIPSMPLRCNIFTNNGTGVVGRVLRHSNVACQLRYLKTPNVQAAAQELQSGAILLLVIKGTDIAMGTPTTDGDYVECPAGTGRFYWVYNVDDVAKGFANEYRAAAMQPQNMDPFGWPLPPYP